METTLRIKTVEARLSGYTGTLKVAYYADSLTNLEVLIDYLTDFYWKDLFVPTLQELEIIARNTPSLRLKRIEERNQQIVLTIRTVDVRDVVRYSADAFTEDKDDVDKLLCTEEVCENAFIDTLKGK